MKSARIWTIAGLLIIIGVIAVIAVFRESSPKRGDEMQSDFAWFDALGFPSSEDAEFVRINNGSRNLLHPDFRKNQIYGFLLKDDEAGIHFLDLQFTERNFSHEPHKGFEGEPPSYEATDFSEHAQQLLSLGVDEERPRADIKFPRSPLFPNRSFAFIQAWRAQKRGNGELAAKLYAKAHDFPVVETLANPGSDFRASIEAEIAQIQFWKRLFAFGDLEVDRPELLRGIEKFRAAFSDSEYAERASRMSERLEKMIQEDLAKAAEEAPDEPTIADWIFQLRDQPGLRFYKGVNLSGGVETPGNQLIYKGKDAAIPQLIEALDNLDFIRGMSLEDDKIFSHDVVRIGDCAALILGRITHDPLFENHIAIGYLDPDPTAHPKTKVEAERWWAEFQELGEEEMLVRDVSSGKNGAAQKAGTLATRYKNRLLESIAKGMPACEDPKERERLLRWFRHTEGDAAIPYLMKEMKESPFRPCRLVAAELLFQRGQTEPAILAILDEWGDRAEWLVGIDGPVQASWTLRPLAEFLLNSTDERAVDGLFAEFGDRDFLIRYEILGNFWRGPRPLRIGNDVKIYPPKVLAKIEQLLATSLEDLEPYLGLRGSRNEQNYHDPRLCDIAAEGLAAWFPDRYQADTGATYKIREANRIRLLNDWRKRADPIEPTQFFEPQPVDAAVLNSLLAKSGDSDARAKIEKLGLGALPALFAAEQALSDADPEKAVLRESVMRFANRVGRVTIIGAIDQADAGWLRLTRELEGEELTGERFAEILRAFATDTDPRWGGIRLEAVRHQDLTGVDIRLEILPPGDSGKAWNQIEGSGQVALGKFHIAGWVGPQPDRYTPEGLADFVKAAATALAYPPDAEATIREQLLRIHED